MFNEIFEMIVRASPWVKFVHVAVLTLPFLILIGAYCFEHIDDE